MYLDFYNKKYQILNFHNILNNFYFLSKKMLITIVEKQDIAIRKLIKSMFKFIKKLCLREICLFRSFVKSFFCV
jgi:hypothetical protein